MADISQSECIAWFAVGTTESLLGAIINILTIIVFAKNRSLRKRSTYLLINLTVADLLAGGVGGPLYSYLVTERLCGLFEMSMWSMNLISAVYFTFTFVSLSNLAIISLERLHATFCPFKHRFIKKWVYGVVIAVNWPTVSLASFVMHFFSPDVVGSFLGNFFILISFLVICISCVLIVTKVRCGHHPQHHGATNRERKLTVTLIIVIVVSLFTCLPLGALNFLTSTTHIMNKLSYPENFRIAWALVMLFFANALLNPLIYTIRMPEFRTAVRQLFRKFPERRRVNAFPLQNM